MTTESAWTVKDQILHVPERKSHVFFIHTPTLVPHHHKASSPDEAEAIIGAIEQLPLLDGDK